MEAVIGTGRRQSADAAQKRGSARRLLPARHVDATFAVVMLIAVALLMHHGYLTTAPLASDDWSWVSNSWLRSLYPWPSAWDPTSGFGTATFARLYTAPFEALWGVLAQTGLDWNVLEKAFYFIPFSALSVLGPWLLARELLGSGRWAVLSALIFATNTHLLLRGTAHLAIACAFAVGTLVFWADVRAKRMGGPRWAVLTGLLLALQAVYDIRIAVLAVWCLLLKLVLEMAVAGSWHNRLRYIGLSGAALLIFGIAQLSWAIPLLLHGNTQLPIGDAPVQAYATLGNGFTARDPLWTGGPVLFRASELPWLAFITPLVAFSALTLRRIRLEFLWLLVCALLAAFLIKQDGAPAGTVYDWLFAHVPTWNLFREATKLFWITAIAYAVVIPYVVKGAWSALRVRGHTMMATLAVAALLAYPLADAAANATALTMGHLGGTTVSTHFPASFGRLQALLAADPQHSVVAFIGGAAVTDTTIHRFPLASEQHPDLELWGTTHPYDPTAADNDLLNAYCPGGGVPFCYLQPSLFPYLMRELGVGYVVAPASPGIGALPWGTTFQQLTSRVSAILGQQPAHVSAGTDSLSVWRLPSDGAMLVGSPTVANVAAPPGATMAALPALQALDVPAIFNSGGSTPSIPDSIAVIPALGRQYSVPTTGSYVMALPSGAKAPSTISIDGHQIPTRTLLTSAHGGVQLLGPLSLASGSTTIDAGGVEGPLVEWSSSAVGAGESEQPEVAISSMNRPAAAAFSAPGNPWLLLRQAYDAQWRLDGADAHVQADGMLNAYHLPNVPVSTPLEIRYVAAEAQPVGITASVLGCLAAIVTTFASAWFLRARTRRREDGARAGNHADVDVGRGKLMLWAARLGIAFVVLAMGSYMLQSIGWPPPHPGSAGDTVGPGNVPFTDSSLYYLTFGMAILFLAITMRVLGGSRRAGLQAADGSSSTVRVAEARDTAVASNSDAGGDEQLQ